jgi:glycosyltransferase involved in cell wall biosynthesis
MKVSYLITCSTETDTLKKLLYVLVSNLNVDEIVILQDGNDEFTTKTLDLYRTAYDYYETNISFYKHDLNNDYGAHKNYGIEKCSGDYVFQLDGDELPPGSLLGENLQALLENNPTTEAYAVPRMNDFRGVTQEHAKQWGWRLTNSPSLNRPIVNFPDFQFRIFKRDFPRISFRRKLHEKIEGYDSYVMLPAEEEYALYHDKTIETQIQTNLRYNKLFSVEDNKGHNLI